MLQEQITKMLQAAFILPVVHNKNIAASASTNEMRPLADNSTKRTNHANVVLFLLWTTGSIKLRPRAGDSRAAASFTLPQIQIPALCHRRLAWLGVPAALNRSLSSSQINFRPKSIELIISIEKTPVSNTMAAANSNDEPMDDVDGGTRRRRGYWELSKRSTASMRSLFQTVPFDARSGPTFDYSHRPKGIFMTSPDCSHLNKTLAISFIGRSNAKLAARRFVSSAIYWNTEASIRANNHSFVRYAAWRVVWKETWTNISRGTVGYEQIRKLTTR